MVSVLGVSVAHAIGNRDPRALRLRREKRTVPYHIITLLAFSRTSRPVNHYCARFEHPKDSSTPVFARDHYATVLRFDADNSDGRVSQRTVLPGGVSFAQCCCRAFCVRAAIGRGHSNQRAATGNL